jgi:predicted RecB family endonuclease
MNKIVTRVKVPNPLVDNRIDEIMRLASLMATARCVRAAASKKGDLLAEAQAQVRVVKATGALRDYLEKVLA